MACDTSGLWHCTLHRHFIPRATEMDTRKNRRGSPRRPLALPVRVRPEHVPWFEEAMTIDVSAQGLRFLSNREYQEGARLLISFEPAALAPWPTRAETAARVARIEAVPESAVIAVAIVREE